MNVVAAAFRGVIAGALRAGLGPVRAGTDDVVLPGVGGVGGGTPGGGGISSDDISLLIVLILTDFGAKVVFDAGVNLLECHVNFFSRQGTIGVLKQEVKGQTLCARW